MISQFLEHDYFENVDLFAASIKDEVNFKPAGVLLDSFSVNESKYPCTVPVQWRERNT